MRPKRVIFLLSAVIMLLSSVCAQAQNRTFIFVNQMNEDIWVGCQGNPLPANGGFALPRGASVTITVPFGASAIRFWGRTGCNFNASGAGTCASGDCARGLYCNGAGGIPPATLAEFTMNGAGNQDFYDISLVDGYNVPIRIVPVPGTFTVPAGAGKYGCGVAGCTSDLLLTCPTELRTYNSSGQTVGCMSACMKYGTSQYCCTGPNNQPSTCPPTSYSQIFKAACPDAYSYAYDDQTSTYICLNATYQIIFGTGGTPPPTGVITAYKDCNYAGYAVGLPVGTYTAAQMQSRGILNDDISSLRVSSGYEVQLFWDDNFTGQSLVVNADNSCLVAAGWNDKVSSMIVRTSSTNFSRTIQAESYSAMAGVQLENTTDAGGGQNVGWIDANDWMAYNGINFPSSGTYKVEYRVASLNGGRVSLDLNAGSIQLGQLAVPATGGWQNWTTISHNVTVNAGTYALGVFAVQGGWNLNWIRITKVNARLAVDPTLDPRQGSTAVNVSVKELEAYPNPAANQVFLSSDFNFSGAKLNVYNATGEEVFSGIFNSAMDISSFESGVYTVVVITENDQRYSSRFVKE